VGAQQWELRHDLQLHDEIGGQDAKHYDDPQADAVLSKAPDSIRLWFNQAPELALAAISLEGEDGIIDVGSVLETDDAKSIKV
jgi:hypothetical protein